MARALDIAVPNEVPFMPSTFRRSTWALIALAALVLAQPARAFAQNADAPAGGHTTAVERAAAEGERIAAQIRTRAQQEAEETRERALKDIETARKQAISDLYDQAATLATSVAEKILRRNLNPDDQRDLVSRSLEQFQTVGKY